MSTDSTRNGGSDLTFAGCRNVWRLRRWAALMRAEDILVGKATQLIERKAVRRKFWDGFIWKSLASRLNLDRRWNGFKRR